jgi:hypothetical protein
MEAVALVTFDELLPSVYCRGIRTSDYPNFGKNLILVVVERIAFAKLVQSHIPYVPTGSVVLAIP